MSIAIPLSIQQGALTRDQNLKQSIDNFIELYGKLPENTEFITRVPITQKHLEEVLEVKSEEQ